MSTVVVLAFKTGEIGIWADTMVTRKAPVGPIAGRTTQGEAFQPISTKDGVLYFDEGACKIGAFGDKTICAITTDNSDFAIELIVRVEKRLFDPISLPNIHHDFHFALVDMSGKVGNPGFAQYIIATEVSEGRCFFLLEASRNDKGECFLNHGEKLVVKGEEWGDIFGSGKAYLDNINKSGLASVTQFYYQDSSAQKIFPFLVATNISNWLKISTNNSAAGVGGAFLGHLLTDKGIITTPEAMHVVADPSSEIKVFCKHVYSDSVFTVHDLVSRHLMKFETLDGAMKRWNNAAADLTKNDEIAMHFSSPFIAVDKRSEEDPDAPNVSIVENQEGKNAMHGPHFESDAVVYPLPEEPISFTPSNGIKLTLKMSKYIPRESGKP
ncbi:hypothetical protein [Bdellovibrio sp. HCB-162]|uniref:hypothetical protein n=1 Tax=Bdellovibrio sp. HCB-162 TaxID=3394234 RepID=UPI0039BC357E